MKECPCDSCNESHKNCVYSCEKLRNYRREKTLLNNEKVLRYKNYNASLWNGELVKFEKAPCMDCNERYLGCHGKCEKYQAFRTERNRLNDQRFKKVDSYYNPQNTTKRRRNTMLNDFKYRRDG